MKILKTKTLIGVFLLWVTLGFAQNNTAINLQQKLQELFPTASITPISNLTGYTESYKIILNQLLDHKNPSKGTFKQYVYLSHLDYTKPMVIETHGYDTNNTKSEVSTLLNTNQVAVEYRFYGNSRPNPIPWEYLTNAQAVEDYHDIATKLKTLYTNKWISTGISKGGETALIYKAKYPNDVAISIPYVAPMIIGEEDQRTNTRINTNGTAACRSKIVTFQRAVLQNRTAILSLLSSYATTNGIAYTKVSMEEALEYSVLEFPFSFWQWSGNCTPIPAANATPTQLFNYLNSIAAVSFYGDSEYDKYLPSFYQHSLELGYYGFDLAPVQDLLQVVKSSSNRRFAPLNTPLYDPTYMQGVRNYLETAGQKIMYIYGGNDPWGACLVSPNAGLDFKMMTLPLGTHSTRISSFPTTDKTQIMSTLNRWLTETNLSVNNNNNLEYPVQIYPTQTLGLYSIEMPASITNYTIKVYTVLGQLIQTKAIQNTQTILPTLDLSSQLSGTYILKIESANNLTWTKKIIR